MANCPKCGGKGKVSVPEFCSGPYHGLSEYYCPACNSYWEPKPCPDCGKELRPISMEPGWWICDSCDRSFEFEYAQEKVTPKRRHTCPVCGQEVDEPITSEDLEEASADRFFQDAIDDEEAGK